LFCLVKTVAINSIIKMYILVLSFVLLTMVFWNNQSSRDAFMLEVIYYFR